MRGRENNPSPTSPHPQGKMQSCATPVELRFNSVGTRFPIRATPQHPLFILSATPFTHPPKTTAARTRASHPFPALPDHHPHTEHPRRQQRANVHPAAPHPSTDHRRQEDTSAASKPSTPPPSSRDLSSSQNIDAASRVRTCIHPLITTSNIPPFRRTSHPPARCTPPPTSSIKHRADRHRHPATNIHPSTFRLTAAPRLWTFSPPASRAWRAHVMQQSGGSTPPVSSIVVAPLVSRPHAARSGGSTFLPAWSQWCPPVRGLTAFGRHTPPPTRTPPPTSSAPPRCQHSHATHHARDKEARRRPQPCTREDQRRRAGFPTPRPQTSQGDQDTKVRHRTPGNSESGSGAWVGVAARNPCRGKGG